MIENKIKNFVKYILNNLGQEEDNPVSELLNHSPFNKGWHSARFCQYPQEIILDFPNKVKVKQIQFLSHQYKISTKIELMIFNPGQTKKFKKIGYLSLDSNERSNFQARELKSVYIDHECQKIKLVLHKNYTNKHNTFNQVGIISVNVNGEYLNRLNSNNIITDKVEEIKNNSQNNYEDNIRYDPVTAGKIRELSVIKDEAISQEDFDKAQSIKNAISRLKSVANQLLVLEERKQNAVKNDEFDKAKLLKFEIENLRNKAANIDVTAINNSSNNANNYDNYNHNHNNNMNNQHNERMKLNSNQGMRSNNTNIPDININSNNKTKNKFDSQAGQFHIPQTPENLPYIYDKNNTSRNNLATPQMNMNKNNTDKNFMNNPYNNNNNNNKSGYEEPQMNQNNYNNSNPNSKNNTNTKFNMQKNKQISNNNNNQAFNDKSPIDVDNIQVGGNQKNFDEMVEEQVKSEKQKNNKKNTQENDANTNDNDDISEKEYPIAEPFIRIFSYDYVKMLFSKSWKIKEEGIMLIKDEITKYPKSSIIDSKSYRAEDLISKAFGVTELILKSNTPQPALAVMDLLKAVLVKYNKLETLGKNVGNFKQDLVRESEKVLQLMLEKTADANAKLKEKAESTINDLADSVLVGDKLVMDYLIKGKVNKIYANSAKHLISRYNLLARNLEFYGLESIDSVDDLVKFAVNGYNNKGKDVRDAAFNLIMKIYQFIGDDIKKYFKDLRPAQISVLEEGFEGVIVDNDNKNNQHKAINKNFVNEIPNNNPNPKKNINNNNNANRRPSAFPANNPIQASDSGEIISKPQSTKQRNDKKRNSQIKEQNHYDDEGK